MNYEKWKQLWRIGKTSERMGQAFCNDFIKDSWSELYFENDYWKADDLITQWLVDNHYYPNTPLLIEEDY